METNADAGVNALTPRLVHALLCFATSTYPWKPRCMAPSIQAFLTYPIIPRTDVT